MRTLSARILLGFAALTVTFGVITATVVVNMSRVEDVIHQLRQGYVPLALVSKDLARREDDLKGYLEEGIKQEPNSASASMALRIFRDKRNASLAALRKNTESLATLIEADLRFTASVDQLQTMVDNLRGDYDQVITALRKGEDVEGPAIADQAKQLRDAERRIDASTNELSNSLETAVRRWTIWLEDNEHKLRIVTIYLGLVAIVLGLLITTWVVITLRPLRQLRDAARRVASGDYASRIPERGPAEVRDLARELNSMARAVEERERELVRSERLAAVGKLSAMITHEVRNPLSSIGLNAELLEDELADNAEARELCRAIHHEVDRLTKITDEYLAFGRMPKPKLTSEHVNQIVDALASFVREDLAAKDVSLVLELGSDDPIALIDASQLRQCLINLVRNAAEAVTAKGGGKVTVRTRRMGDRVVVEVEDEGPGIPADVLPRLFDPFFSTKEGGSGLGLSLTQQIVKDHGGELAVDSVVGRGTTFTVSVPRG